MVFKVGDRVVIHKPVDVTELPIWTEDMDEYDGFIGSIKSFSLSSTDWCTIKGGDERDTGYRYNLKWLTLDGAESPELKNKSNQEKSMASVETLENAKLSADDLFARNESLESPVGRLYGSSAGQVFLQYLYDQGDNRKNFIKAVRDAKKKVAQEEALYTKSVTADKEDSK